MSYCILEVEDGRTIVEVPVNQTAEDIALVRGAVVIDPGPFDTYEDVNEALLALEAELLDEESDAPAERAMESRNEERPT